MTEDGSEEEGRPEGLTGGTGEEGMIRTSLPLSRVEKGALLLLLGAPLAIIARVLGGPSLLIFGGAGAAIMPLALLMGRATEELAIRSGPGMSAFLLATFGNATELIIAAVAINKGLVGLARASLVGSIIINILLVLGLSFVVGGHRFKVMNFQKVMASATLSMLTVSVVGILMPTLFHYSHFGFVAPGEATEDMKDLSLFVAAVLLSVYFLYMLFSMKTHRRYFNGEADQPIDRTLQREPELATWPTSTALVMLAMTMVCVVAISEIFIGEVERIVADTGISEFFLAVIVIALVGNAAEHSSAILMAWKGRIELSFQIAMGSSVQIALMVAPLLVFFSFIVGHPMTLVFSMFGLVAIVLTLAISIVITIDGQATWFEGAMLVAIFVLLAAAAYLAD